MIGAREIVGVLMHLLYMHPTLVPQALSGVTAEDRARSKLCVLLVMVPNHSSPPPKSKVDEMSY